MKFSQRFAQIFQRSPLPRRRFLYFSCAASIVAIEPASPPPPEGAPLDPPPDPEDPPAAPAAAAAAAPAAAIAPATAPTSPSVEVKAATPSGLDNGSKGTGGALSSPVAPIAGLATGSPGLISGI